VDARIRGSAVNWAGSWDVAFDAAFMQRIGSWLAPGTQPKA
jgi:hypothetical protein